MALVIEKIVKDFGEGWELWSRRYDNEKVTCYFITKHRTEKMSYWRKYDAKRGLLLRKNRGE